MSVENQLWGAPRIHGELLKPAFDVAQSTVAKYMVNGRAPAARAGGRFCAITRRILQMLVKSKSVLVLKK